MVLSKEKSLIGTLKTIWTKIWQMKKKWLRWQKLYTVSFKDWSHKKELWLLSEMMKTIKRDPLSCILTIMIPLKMLEIFEWVIDSSLFILRMWDFDTIFCTKVWLLSFLILGVSYTYRCPFIQFVSFYSKRLHIYVSTCMSINTY